MKFGLVLAITRSQSQKPMRSWSRLKKIALENEKTFLRAIFDRGTTSILFSSCDLNLTCQVTVSNCEQQLAAVITQRMRDSLLSSAVKFIDVCSAG